MKDYNKLSETEQAELVKKNGFYIKYINSPSEKVQIEAVKQNGDSIYYIKDPSDIVQIEVIKNLDYDDYNDNFVKRYIKSESAKELYKKMVKVKNIII